MKRILAAALAATSFATPALAQTDAANFTGLRVEGLVGYDYIGLPGADNPDGLLYGVGVGYDFQAGSNIIFGVEADVTDSDAKVSLLGPDVVTDRDISVGGRVGVVAGRGLIYAKAAYTNARFEQNGFGSTELDGVRFGGGFEYALGTNAYLKAEYRYSNYEGGVDRNQALGGFGFRF